MIKNPDYAPKLLPERWPREKTIYLSGPYTAPDPGENVHAAAQWALKLEEKGWLVIVPHQSHLRHLITPKPYQYWMRLDLMLISLCGAWTRFNPDDPSPGSEQEREQAEKFGLHLFDRIEDVPDLRGHNA